MIKVSDLILAVGILAFFLLTDQSESGNNDNTGTGLEMIQYQEFPLDSLSNRTDLYNSYADFTY